MTEIEGRLPIFSGFYGTVFDPDYALDVDYMVRSRLESLLDNAGAARNFPEKFCRKAVQFCYENTDIQRYQDAVVKFVATCTEKWLNKLLPADAGVRIVRPLLYSPREYNFRNDCINALFQFRDYEKFRTYALSMLTDGSDSARDMWTAFLQHNFTTRSGFISFYSNDSDVWIEKTDSFRHLDEIELWAIVSALFAADYCMSHIVRSDSVYEQMEVDMYQDFCDMVDVDGCVPDALDVIECDEMRKQATDLIMESNPEFDLDAALLGLLEATRERKQEHHED